MNMDMLEKKCKSETKSWMKCSDCGKRMYFVSSTFDMGKLTPEERKFAIAELKEIMKPMIEWIDILKKAKKEGEKLAKRKDSKK